ncbi:unnamed protein product, partial [Mesorhabditis belari]|uniref:Uncharacterized protein n=1 Tax=Mesorhabditis belari TaxID=2138241 RepID=A0AAF3FDB0_9BILA
MRTSELLQNFSEPEEEGFWLGTDRRDGSKGFFLTDCGGFFNDMLAVARDEHLNVFDVFKKETLCQKSFEEDDEITSVVYHHLLSSDPEGQPGILVGVNNMKKQRFLVYVLTINMGEATVLRKVRIAHPVTSLRTLVSSHRMEQAKVALHPRMRTMPHVICIGTKNGHCYIGQLEVSDSTRPENWDEELTLKMTDALKDFASRDATTFEYQAHGQKLWRFPVDEVFVSAIGFVERARTLVIGLNFGGIVVCSLSDQPSIESIPHQMFQSEPKFIEAMVPENDPRPRLYFAVAFNCSQATAAGITLFVMEFPTDERESMHDPTKWQYKDLAVIPFLKISTPDMRAWISMRCIVGADSKYHAELNETISINTGPSAAHSRTLLSFFYLSRDQETRRLKTMGGLFDLNQHYYKRQVPKIVYDGTLANQCPFISFIHDVPCKMMEEFYPLEAMVDPKDLRRFASDISNDLIPTIYFTDGLVVRQLSASSLQQQVLKRIVENLYESLCKPDAPFAWLQSIGLIQASLDETFCGPDQAMAGVLTNVVYHHYTVELLNLCRNQAKPLPAVVLQSVFEWIWSEAERQYQNMHNIVDPLFRGMCVELNDADQRSLNACESIFGCAQRILPLYLDLLNGEAAGLWELRSETAQSFLHCLTFIYSLRCDKMLPINDQTRKVTQRIKEQIESRRMAATNQGKQLYIDALLKRIHDRVRTKADLIWLDRDVSRSYPPTLLDLVSLFPMFDISGKLKRSLILYYLLDYHSANGSNNLLMALEDFYAGNGRMLRFTKEELRSVYAEWLGDVALEAADKKEQNNSLKTDKDASFLDIRKELFEATTKLMSSEGYNAGEAVRIKDLMERVYGHPLDKIMWNLLLIDHAFYDDVDIEMEVPKELEGDQRVQRYLLMVEYLRLSNYKSVKEHTKKYALSEEIMSKYRAKKNESENLPVKKESPRTSIFRAESYAKKLKQMNLDAKRSDNLLITPEKQGEATFAISPKKARLLHFDDEDTSINFMDNVPSEELDQLRQVIQTPKARANAAARAEGHFRSNMVTPEEVKELPPPTSILRSAHKQTPTRGNIRWDPEVVTPVTTFSNDETRHDSIPFNLDEDEDVQENNEPLENEELYCDSRETIEEPPQSGSLQPAEDQKEENYFGEESFRIITREEQSDSDKMECEPEEPSIETNSSQLVPKDLSSSKETIQTHYTYKEEQEVHVNDQVVQKVTNIETTTVRICSIDEQPTNIEPEEVPAEENGLSDEAESKTPTPELTEIPLITPGHVKLNERPEAKEKSLYSSPKKAPSVSPTKEHLDMKTPTKLSSVNDDAAIRRSSRKTTPRTSFMIMPETRRSPSRSTRKLSKEPEHVEKTTNDSPQKTVEPSTSKASSSRQLFNAEALKRKPIEQRLVKLEDVLPRKGRKPRTTSESHATTTEEQQRRTPGRPKRAVSSTPSKSKTTPTTSATTSGRSSRAASTVKKGTALETVPEKTPSPEEKATPRRLLRSATKEKSVAPITPATGNLQRTPSARKRTAVEPLEDIKRSRKK